MTYLGCQRYSTTEASAEPTHSAIAIHKSRSRASDRFLSPIIIKIHATKPDIIAIPGNTSRNIPETSLSVLVASLAGLVAFPPVCSAKASDTEFNVNKAVIPSVDALVFTLFKNVFTFKTASLNFNICSLQYSIYESQPSDTP